MLRLAEFVRRHNRTVICAALTILIMLLAAWTFFPAPAALDAAFSQATATPFPTRAMTGAVARATLFTTMDCSDCQIAVRFALAPLSAQYGTQFEVKIVDVVTPADVEYVYQVAESYGLSRDAVDLPLVIIGSQVLVDEEIPARLSGLVQGFLLTGGVDFPLLPPRHDATATPAPAMPPAEVAAPASSAAPVDGLVLTGAVMMLMAAALIYSLIAIAVGRTHRLPAWTAWLVPVLVVSGLGVAGYLLFVETQPVNAVNGPVGNCNTVQSSRYARLFSVLPVGLFGLLGYLALLAVWIVQRVLRRMQRIAAIVFFGVAFFGVAFSLYLSYLELFAIRAVCLWSLPSAVIATLLLLLSLPPSPNRMVEAAE